MIAFEELLERFVGLERRELARWVENRWVLPEQRGKTWVFREIAHAIAGLEPPPPPTIDEQHEVMRWHVERTHEVEPRRANGL